MKAQITALINPEVLNEFQKLSNERGISRSACIEGFMRRYIQKYSPNPMAGTTTKNEPTESEVIAE